jgi:hypothetical protein
MASTTLIERPNSICLSKNEIRYAFYTSDLSPAGLSVQIILFVAGKQFTANLKPTALGITYFYIDAYIDSLLTYQLPSATAMFTDAATQKETFYIHYREVTEATPNPAYITSEASHVRTAFKMGISREKYSRNNYFANYFASQKPWLTWQPSGKTVQPNQNVYLTFLLLPVHAGKTVALQIIYTDVTGVSYHAPMSLGVVPATGMYQHVNVGLAGFNLPTTNKIFYYTVAIVDSGTFDVLVSYYQLFVSYDYLYNYYDLLYHNSLSGVDCLRIIGDVQKVLNKDFAEVDNGFDVNDWNATTKKADTSHVGFTLYDSFKGDVGFIDSEEDQDALIELLVSRSIYQYVDSRFLPVLNLQKNTDLRVSTDKKYSLPIEWRLGIANHVFTPANIALGLGTDTETY